MLSRLEFFLTETFVSLRRHPAMAFAAMVCVAATLFVAGLVVLAVLNARYAVDTAVGRYRIGVYFRPETTRAEAEGAHARIQGLAGVAAAVFVGREEAWEKLLKEEYSGETDFERLIGGNPLPYRVDVKPRDLEAIAVLVTEIEKWPSVYRVSREESVAGTLRALQRGVALAGTAVGLVLLLVSLIIIHHTIALTYYARRKEIEIMALVGATPLTIATPFVLEGALYGALGGLAAAVALGALYHVAAVNARQMLSWQLLQDPDTMRLGWEALIVAGAALGLVASAVSAFGYVTRRAGGNVRGDR